METFFLWQAKSAIYLTAFYCVYLAFLRNERFFGKNRAYLIITSLLAFILPFVRIPAPEFIQTANLSKYLLNSVSDYSAIGDGAVATEISYSNAMFVFYAIIAGMFTLLFLYRIAMVMRIIFKHKSENIDGFRIVSLNDDSSPFSFFKTIFINPRKYSEREYGRILSHEQVHASQLHSLDLMLIEIITILHWFNPIVRFYKNAFMEVHEYLADSSVVRNGAGVQEYGNLILKEVIESPSFSMVNNFSFSMIKRRIMMISQECPSKHSAVRLFAGLPVALFLILGFSSVKFDPNETLSEQKLLPNTYKSIAIVNAEEENRHLNRSPEVDRVELAKHVKYPARARKSQIQGIVMINALVSETGFPIQVKVKNSSHRVFNSSAVKAVKCVRFTPALQDGKSIKAWVSIPVQFKLNEVS
jgi:TonB family protein